MKTYKTYLGDAVYVERSDAGDIVLTTSDGILDTNTIFLDQHVLKALLEWLKR